MNNSKEKKENTKDKIHYFKYNGFGHVMHECLTKNNDQDPKEKSVPRVTMESNDDGSDDCLSKFCFVAIEEKKEEDFERAFEEFYVETIHLAKKNKELKKQIEVITKDKDALQEKFKCKELEVKHSKAREEELQSQLASNEKDINKIFRWSHKLTNMLLHQKSPLCKLELGGHNYDGEFNKPINLVKAYTLSEKITPRRLTLSREVSRERSL